MSHTRRCLIRFLQAVAVVNTLLVCGHSLLAQETTSADEVDIQAETYRFDLNTGIAEGTGKVECRYRDIFIRADQVRYNRNNHEIEATGNVLLEQEGFRWEGPRVTGNMETGEFSVDEYRATVGPWHLKGDGGEHDSEGGVRVGAARFTTCEYEHPHYSLEAGRIVYSPNGQFRAYNCVVRFRNVPVFYLPVVFGNTGGEGRSGIEIKPGYDSDWGAYLLLANSWQLADDLSTRFSLDLRAKNGVALGNETDWRTDSSRTRLLVYGMHDNDPPETAPGFNRGFEVEEDRYRLRLSHDHEFTDELRLRLHLDKLSDVDMLEDWFRSEYRTRPQPESAADLTYESERLTLSLLARPKVNDFYTVVERLPEARLALPRQPLAGTGLYLSSDLNAAYLRTDWRDFDRPRPLGLARPEDYESGRLDALTMLYYPLSPMDGLQVVPRVGGRVTYYSRSSDTPVTTADLNDMFAVDDPDNEGILTPLNAYDHDGGSRTRYAGEVGLEVSTKFYRTWSRTRNSLLDLDGLRHVVQPYANYTYLGSPNENKDNLYYFDMVDRLEEWNFVRVGAGQRWQTRRRGEIYTFAALDTYADFHFSGENDPDDLGTLGVRGQLNPSDRIQFQGTVVTNMDTGNVDRSDVTLQLGSPDSLTVGISYLFRDDYLSRAAYSMGSYLTDFDWAVPVERFYQENHYLAATLGFPITDKTRGLVRYEYDLEEGSLARQLYELHRDLHCWQGILRVDEEEGDVQVSLVFYLTAYPSIDLAAGL
jgi:lipopolysaccharide assembly outer membrane protein LptD (OstA)